MVAVEREIPDDGEVVALVEILEDQHVRADSLGFDPFGSAELSVLRLQFRRAGDERFDGLFLARERPAFEERFVGLFDRRLLARQVVEKGFRTDVRGGDDFIGGSFGRLSGG